MHILDGALSTPVLVIGGALAAGGVVAGLKTLQVEDTPKAGLMSAAFFIASMIHLPVGPSSIHLVLGGLMGLTLGLAAFPAFFIALLLQAAFFGFGGLTTLGVNTVILATPAALLGWAARDLICSASPSRVWAYGAAVGGGAVLLSSLLTAVALGATGEAFIPAAKLVVFSHLPLMALEACVTGVAVALLHRVKPESLRPTWTASRA